MRMVLFLHLVGMSLWLGGQLFLAAVAVPALRGAEPDLRRETFRRLGRAFGIAGIAALVLIIATGLWMMLELDLSPADHAALRHKLELVGVVLVGTVVHAVAGARRWLRVSRVASIVTLLATLGVVWYALGI